MWWIKDKVNRALLVVTVWILLLLLITATILAYAILERNSVLDFIHTSTVKQNQIIALQKENQQLLQKTRQDEKDFAVQGEASVKVALWITTAMQAIAADLHVALPPFPKLP